MLLRILVLLAATLAPAAILGADQGNRLTYLDGPCDPFYVGLDTAKLVTPQWAGDEGVELAVVLAVDDMKDPAVYEKFLAPIVERLQKIDGRAPISIMTTQTDPRDPRLQAFLKAGLSIETHTFDHPCPCLEKGSLTKAKGTFDRSVDLLARIPNSRPVAFRMPCCDSMNSVSPRFFCEIFNKTTPEGHFLTVDASVFQVFTADDPTLARELVQAPGRPRFGKYLPMEREYANYVENYPYPYVIGRLCWEVPTTAPSDWEAFNLHGRHNLKTVEDWKAALDATAVKQGVFTLCFHPHDWIRNTQVAELIDHAATRHGKKVKVYTLREVCERLTKNLLGGVPLRAANGQDNGVRVLDLNHDGYMDVIVGNEKVRQTRLWSPEKRQWMVGDFPAPIVSVDAQGNRSDAGVRFGVLQKNGRASIIVPNGPARGVWHFTGVDWRADPEGLSGLNVDNSAASNDAPGRGVRMVDLDGDGLCELIIGNAKEQAVFGWMGRGWKKLPFTLPDGATIADAEGRDAGCRLVDLNGDGRLDVVFSNPERFGVYLFTSMKEGWGRKTFAGKRPEDNRIPMFVRSDGTNNGAWFKHGHLWVQNEDTGRQVVLPNREKTVIPAERRPYKTLLEEDGQPRLAPVRRGKGS